MKEIRAISKSFLAPVYTSLLAGGGGGGGGGGRRARPSVEVNCRKCQISEQWTPFRKFRRIQSFFRSDLRGRVKNDSQNAGKVHFNNLIFQNFPGKYIPGSPLDAHASGVRTHPSKILPTAMSITCLHRDD